MTSTDITSILNKLKNHETRIKILEGRPRESHGSVDRDKKKRLTLAEIIYEKNLGSGQKKVAIITGYLEKILHTPDRAAVNIEETWKEGMFDGKFDKSFLRRAKKERLIKSVGDVYELTQTGEIFFEEFMKNNDNQKKGK